MAKKYPIYSFLRKLPFKEVLIPLKMLQGAWHNRNAIIPDFAPAEVEGGKLEVHEGTPLLRMRGTPYECGYQHGRLLGEHVRILFDRYLKLFAGNFRYDLDLARTMERYIPQKYVDEMRGLAEGADIPYDVVLVSTCFLDIHKVAACSTFVVHDASSKSGEIMMGRNLDFPALGVAHRVNLVSVYESKDAPPFASVAWPGFLGCLSGMNARGLALAMMLVYGHTRSDHLNGVPFALHYRDVLESCSNVDEAVERFERREYAVCNNIMLADASRNAARLELHTRSVGVERDTPEFPALYCTNHFRTGDRRKALAFTAMSSFPRLWRMSKSAERREAYDEASVKDLLGRVAIKGINLQRIMFYPERGEIEVAFGKPSAGPRHYVRFPRETLFPV